MLYDCIIIGSGLSALTAAKKLTSSGYRPLLLEARDRIGGRAYTVEEGHGGPVDTGCAQIHGYLEGNPVTKLNAELGLPRAHVVKDAQTRIIGLSSSYPGDDVSLLEAAGSAYPPTYPPPSEMESLKSLYYEKIKSPEEKSLSLMLQIGAGLRIDEISAKWWGFGRGYSGTDGAPIGGYSRIINALADEIKSRGATIKLGEEVVEVHRTYLGRSASVEVRTRSGGIYSSRTCISTIPLGVLKSSPPKFSPPLEASFLAAMERATVGTLEKIILSYREAWWPESDIYGNYILLPTSTSHSPPTSLDELFSRTTLNITNLVRTAPTSHPTLLVYISADEAKFISKYSQEDVFYAMHAYLASRLAPPSCAPAPSPTHATVTRWYTDPFSRGATSSPVSLAVSSSGGQAERASPLDFVILSRSMWNGALGWAGEHTDLDHRGSVVGAVVSGEREGKRVAEFLERTPN